MHPRIFDSSKHLPPVNFTFHTVPLLDKRSKQEKLQDAIEAKTVESHDVQRGWRAVTTRLTASELLRTVEDMLGLAPYASGEPVEFRICDNVVYRRSAEVSA